MKKITPLLLVLALIFGLPFSSSSVRAALTESEIEELLQTLEDRSQEMPVAEEFRVKVDPGDLSVVPGLDEDWMNILLLGTDTGSYTLNYGRTDTMIILSVNRVSGKMRLSSLVRDMYVNIPPHNLSNRINAANAFGGPLLAVKTVNETFGLNIRHYVSINFKGFTNVINRLGGVELPLTRSEASIVGAEYSEESILLNGEQALDYVRIRELDNNFGRNERQRKLLSSMFTKLLSGSNMQQTMSALTETLRLMDTNLNINDMLTLVVPVFTGMENMETCGFPAQGDWHYMTSDKAQSVIEFDREATSRKLHDYIYKGIMP